MTAFQVGVAARYDVELPDSAALHRFSLAAPEQFWSSMWDFGGVVGDKGERAFVDAPDMRDARFFPDASLNVVQTMLARDDDTPALLFAREEQGGLRSVISWHELRHAVAAMAHALLREGVVAGDVVAAWLPNIPEAFITALAAATIGAVYTSTSPDFGTSGVLDRFGQVAPTGDPTLDKAIERLATKQAA